jgi:hypothetical protein
LLRGTTTRIEPFDMKMWLPLSIYLEAGLFERFDGAQMIYAGKLRH